MVAGRLAGAGKIGIRVGKVIGRYKMAKHYTLDIADDQFAFTRDQDQITTEAALDGIYVMMDNHYHLLVQTPDANLSAGMRQLNGVYTGMLPMSKICVQR